MAGKVVYHLESADIHVEHGQRPLHGIPAQRGQALLEKKPVIGACQGIRIQLIERHFIVFLEQLNIDVGADKADGPSLVVSLNDLPLADGPDILAVSAPQTQAALKGIAVCRIRT